MAFGAREGRPPCALGLPVSLALPVCICRLRRGLAVLSLWSPLFITWWKGWLCHPCPGLCPLRTLGHARGVMRCSAIGWCRLRSWLRSTWCSPKHVSPSGNGLPGWEGFGLLCLTWAGQLKKLKKEKFSCGSYPLSQPFHATAVNHDWRLN